MRSLYLMIGIITPAAGHAPVPAKVWPETYSASACYSIVGRAANQEAFNRLAEKEAGPGATMKVICGRFPTDKAAEFARGMINHVQAQRSLDDKLKEYKMPPDWEPK
jgi:hypothetical protein